MTNRDGTTTAARSTGRPLGFGAAVGRQVRLLWTSRRPLLLAVAMLAVLVIAGDPWIDEEFPRLLTFWPLWLTVVGPFWAFAVFHNEGPGQRLYHWSLPVDRTAHTLARVVAGLIWLWASFALLIAVGAVVAAADGDVWQLGQIGAAGWLNFFTGPALGYLAVSVLAVTSDYPLRWFFGLLFLVPLTLSLIDEWLRQGWLARAIIRPIADGDWGLAPVMVGGLGEQMLELDRLLRLRTDPQAQLPPESFSVEYWWIATAVWLVLVAGVVWLAASRHPDTLPRIRRSG